MSKKFKAFPWNAITNPVVTLISSSESADYPLSNLKDPRTSAPFVFVGSEDPCWITADCTLISAAFKKCEELAISTPNIPPDVSMVLKANPADSGWGSPAVTIAAVNTEYDPDTDPSIYGETNLVIRPYKNHKFRLGQDVLSGNNFIRLEIENPSGVAYQINNLGFLWGLQWTLNFRKGWEQGFEDIGALMQSSSVLTHQNNKGGGRTLMLPFVMSDRDDTVYAKYLVSQFGTWRPFWISVEPEAETAIYARDGIRAHRLTFYGKARIVTFTEPSAPSRFSYVLEFKEDFAEIPTERVFPAPPEGIQIPAGTRSVLVRVWGYHYDDTDIFNRRGVCYDHMQFKVNGGSNLLVDPSFEINIPGANICSDPSWPTYGNKVTTYTHGAITLLPVQGTYFLASHSTSGTTFMDQWVDVSAEAVDIDAGTAYLDFSFYYATLSNVGSGGKRNRARVELQFWTGCNGVGPQNGAWDSGELENYGQWLQVEAA